MKAVVAAFNQEKALVGAFSVITNLRMESFEALICSVHMLQLLCRTVASGLLQVPHADPRSCTASSVVGIQSRVEIIFKVGQ